MCAAKNTLIKPFPNSKFAPPYAKKVSETAKKPSKKRDKSTDDNSKNHYHSLQINEEKLQQGIGGDIHIFAEKNSSLMTTQQGVPFSFPIFF